MSTLTITARSTARGRRFHVRYRLGGRAYPVEHAGSFASLKEAKLRRDLVGGEIAAGRNPRVLLDALTAEPMKRLTITFETWTERFLSSRIDVDDNTRKNYRSALRKATKTFGGRDPATITVDEVMTWIGLLADEHKPGTAGLYVVAFRLLLDFVGLDPNPARDPRVKLPKHVRDEPKPPSAEHLDAILGACSAKYLLVLAMIERCATRSGEPLRLVWGDMDVAGLRARLPRGETKRDKPRWLQLPQWLMDAIEVTYPLEDRTPERKVFPHLTEATIYQGMTRACRNAKVPHYTPKDLRHRRASIWEQTNVPIKTIQERMGHEHASMTLDVYSHVMPVTEISDERWMELLGMMGRTHSCMRSGSCWCGAGVVRQDAESQKAA